MRAVGIPQRDGEVRQAIAGDGRGRRLESELGPQLSGNGELDHVARAARRWEWPRRPSEKHGSTLRLTGGYGLCECSE